MNCWHVHALWYISTFMQLVHVSVLLVAVGIRNEFHGLQRLPHICRGEWNIQQWNFGGNINKSSEFERRREWKKGREGGGGRERERWRERERDGKKEKGREREKCFVRSYMYVRTCRLYPHLSVLQFQQRWSQWWCKWLSSLFHWALCRHGCSHWHTNLHQERYVIHETPK